MNRAIVEPLLGIADDPVLKHLFSGRANNLHDAEEIDLNESMPEIVSLFAAATPDDELAEHPLLRLLVSHGSRGREDSRS